MIDTSPTSVEALLDADGDQEGVAGYNYAYLDEHTKREVRRATLKAISLPGHQVPFASREMPLARGWGTGGLQASLSLLGPDDSFKVIDQGSDESVNAANIRRLARDTADVETTTDTTEASIIQTRHRIPEEVLGEGQILVLQVPVTDALRRIDGSDDANRRRHGHRDYGGIWVALYESVVNHGEIAIGARYPVMVDDRYLMDPSPIPRWDTTKLDDAENLFVFAAGREARIYAVPPHTSVSPLAFEDISFRVEDFEEPCAYCGSDDTFRSEVETEEGRLVVCNDTSFCERRRVDPGLPKDHALDRSGVAWGPGTANGGIDEPTETTDRASGEDTTVEDAAVENAAEEVELDSAGGATNGGDSA